MTNIDLSREPVIVVDKDDNEQEVLSREQAEADVSKIIRTVVILLFNKEEQILIQRRQADVRRFPNYWTASASGAVRPKESYPDAAERKLQDELGLTVKLFHQRRELLPGLGAASRMAGLFVGRVDDAASVSPNQVKVSEVRWVNVEEAQKGYLIEPSFAPVLAWWQKSGKAMVDDINTQLS